MGAINLIVCPVSQLLYRNKGSFLEVKMKKLPKAKEWAIKKWEQALSFAKSNKRKTAALAVVIPLFIAGTALASHYYNANSTPLYYVYLDGEEVGTVDHPNRVHRYIQDEIAQHQDKQISPRLKNDLEFKESASLTESPDTAKTMEALKTKIKLVADAKSLAIDRKIVGYVSDRQDVNAILNEIKGQYGPVPAPGEDAEQSMVVEFKEDVEIKLTEVSPNKVITGEQLKTLIQEGVLERQIHTVEPGDCLSCIAAQYGITKKDILRLNPDISEDTLLQLGQEINVTAAKPLLTVRTIEQVEEDVALKYELEVETTDEMYRGDSRVIQAGREGLKKVTYEIVKENGVETEKNVVREEVISEPVNQIILRGTKVKPDRGSGHFIWPANGGRISSPYGPRSGRMHRGIDIARPSNRTIKAADHGRVVSAGWNGGYGNCVVIDHGNGYRTLYAHLSSISVSAGQVVEQGESIGVMGSTGHSTGVHLHFEIIQNGVHRNPMDLIRR